MAGPTYHGAPESGLVVLARDGDEAAFEELVRRRQGAVRGLLRRLSGDPVLGDDLAQEAFLQAWRTLSQLRMPAAFGGWLRQITLNQWLQHARRVRIPTETLETHDVVSGRGTDPARRLDLDAALARLKPPERLCVVLAHGEGMTHSEIAHATGLPLGTVKSHVMRGSARIREWLGPGAIRR